MSSQVTRSGQTVELIWGVGAFGGVMVREEVGGKMSSHVTRSGETVELTWGVGDQVTVTRFELTRSVTRFKLP